MKITKTNIKLALYDAGNLSVAGNMIRQMETAIKVYKRSLAEASEALECIRVCTDEKIIMECAADALKDIKKAEKEAQGTE